MHYELLRGMRYGCAHTHKQTMRLRPTSTISFTRSLFSILKADEHSPPEQSLSTLGGLKPWDSVTPSARWWQRGMGSLHHTYPPGKFAALLYIACNAPGACHPQLENPCSTPFLYNNEFYPLLLTGSESNCSPTSHTYINCLHCDEWLKSEENIKIHSWQP